uniref:Reverse transcriptase domain-containing protein n=1 Tax=Tanacetum cinerariifolium TaxID=118510 RepID=A0A699GY31_TANCI|nr:reverse transcriptase domain-containing protein [Tanacetum cinerariifolium]
MLLPPNPSCLNGEISLDGVYKTRSKESTALRINYAISFGNETQGMLMDCQDKTNLLQLVQANKFHGRENDKTHTHISNFKRMTATLKYRDVLNDAIKLMLFPYSLDDRARIWDVVSKTDDRIDKLADQISNLVEIVNKQVIAPAKAVEKTYVTCGGAHAYYECITTDSNPSSVCAATGSYNQVSPQNQASHQIPPPEFAPVQNNPNRFNQGFQNQPFSVPNNQIPTSVPNEFSSYMKSNEIAIKIMQNQINVLRGDFSKHEENLRRNLKDDMRSILGSFFQNQRSTSGTLPSNTIPNPKGEIKAVTTRSGLAYEGPLIPTESPLEKLDKQNTKEILDKEHSNSSRSTAQVQPLIVPILIPEPDVPRTQKKPTIPYPSSFADAFLLMPKFASTIKSLLANKDKLFELAKVPLNENCSAMLLKKLPENLGDLGKFLIPCNFLGMNVCHALEDLGASINLMPLSIWKKLSLPELTPTRMTLELADRSITRPKGVPEDVFVKVGKFHFPTDFVVVYFEADPRVPLILNRSFLRTGRALIDVYREEITLREKSTIEEPEYSLSMGYEHFITTPVTKLNEVAESSVKNLKLIPSEYKVNSDDESEYNEPIKDDSSSAFTTFTNPPFNDKDNFTIHDEDVSIEESKAYSNPLFDDDEIYSDELESHCLNVESNFVKSLSNHDTLEFDHLDEFFRALMPTHIAEEEQIRKEYAEYISLMERLITINPCPRLMVNANTIVKSLPSFLIPVLDNDSQREEIDIATDTDELLPLSFENDDLEGEIDVLEELCVDNSILNFKNELSNNKASDFDDPSFPRPPPEPPDLEFDFEPNSGKVITAVMNDIEELIDDECFNPGVDIDVSTNVEDDDYFPFIFVIRIFLPYLIYPEVFPLLLFAESEDTIFDPGISV